MLPSSATANQCPLSLQRRDLMHVLREEILAVISRHVPIDPDKVVVKVDRGATVSTLEIDIEVPNVGMRLAPA